jgi:arylsulfatase A-like enzyme
MRWITALTCLILLQAGSCYLLEENLPKKPNVLMICVDDLNDWLGCMGGHPNAKTPHIDRLASGGVLFRNAHCQAPLCGPSRASLMSGLRPSTTGIYGQIKDNDIRRENPTTRDILFLPEYFRRNGYHTMGVGKIFHGHAPDGVFDESGGREPGFGPLPEERFVWSGEANKEGYGGTSTDWGAFPAEDSLMPDYHSARWAIERLNREHDSPFFLAVGFLRPHVPWYVPQKWHDLHPLGNIETPPYHEDDLGDLPAIALAMDDLPMMPSTRWAIDSGEWPRIVQSYLACVSFVDFYIGEILKALEESRHAENTIILLWSDHGYRLGEKHTFAKHCLWEEATHAPLIFAGPTIVKGDVVLSPVEMLSIYPTLLELCGLPPYERNEGISLAPILWGKEELTPNHALTTYGWRNHAVRTRTSRYIRYQDGSEEFYDHRSDPDEWHNLAGTHSGDLEEYEALLPAENAPYARHSKYEYNPFFTQDKLNHSR